jgi:hypothetical protein
MKHTHDVDVTIKLEVPTKDLVVLVDYVQEAAITIIVVAAAASIAKSIFSRGKHGM